MKLAKAYIVGATLLLLADAAHAAYYSNSAEGAVVVNLDTGSYSWQGANGSVVTAPVSSSYDWTSSTVSGPQTVVVQPQPGVPGSFDIINTTTTNTYHTTTGYDTVSLNYSGDISGALSGSNTVVLNGQISKNGSVAGAPASANVDSALLSMSIFFGQPYTAGSAKGTLTLSLGDANGSTIYGVSKSFKTNSGSISLSDPDLGSVDLSDVSLFQAVYSITAPAGTTFSLGNLSLNLGLSDNQYSNTSLTGTKTTVTTVYHQDLPPLATPLPAAGWLLASGVAGLVGYRRKMQEQG